MTLLLVGSTGRTGQFIRSYVESRGASVKRLVRSPHEPCSDSFIVIGDVRDEDTVQEAMKGVSGVICALGTEGNGTLMRGMDNLISAMCSQGINRIVTIGTAGILPSTVEPGLLRYQSIENKRTNHEAAIEHHHVYTELAKTTLEWTIVCPTRLVQQAKESNYRFQRERLPEGGNQISFEATAEFAAAEYFNREYVKARVGISV